MDHSLSYYVQTYAVGALSGGISRTSLAPIERLKILIQVTNKHFSFKHCKNEFIRIYIEEGFLSFWKGNTVALLR